MERLRQARLRVRETPYGRRIYVGDHPLTTMFKGAVFSAFALVFISTVVALIFPRLTGGFPAITAVAIGIGAGITAAAGFRQLVLMRSGVLDLVLNHDGTWLLPRSRRRGRDNPPVRPVRVTTTGRYSGVSVTVVWDEFGTEQRANIVAWASPDRADAFCSWLREQLPPRQGPGHG